MKGDFWNPERWELKNGALVTRDNEDTTFACTTEDIRRAFPALRLNKKYQRKKYVDCLRAIVTKHFCGVPYKNRQAVQLVADVRSAFDSDDDVRDTLIPYIFK